MSFFDRHIVIKDPIDIRSQAFIERFGLLRHRYFSIYDPMPEILAEISVEPRAAILRSMPSDLANLVQTAESNGIRFPLPRLVFSDSETLDKPTRNSIENFFGTPVLDFYANTETGIAAFQTPDSNGRYLIPEDLVILETVTNPLLQDGDTDIVLTGLLNRTTPIIRYRIGDVADGRVCRDQGAPFSNIDGVHGKYLDFLVRTDGSIVSSHAAKQNLTHVPGIEKFQVQQQEIGRVVIRIQRASDWLDSTEVRIRSDFARDFGSDTEINIEFVESLSKETNNYRKFKVVESKVSQELLTSNPCSSEMNSTKNVP